LKQPWTWSEERLWCKSWPEWTRTGYLRLAQWSKKAYSTNYHWKQWMAPVISVAFHPSHPFMQHNS
jgi:hypothetical protein